MSNDGYVKNDFSLFLTKRSYISNPTSSCQETKEEFIAGKEGITNFAYFLAETQYAKKLKPRQLLIIDEAHNIELQLSKFIEVTISERFAKTVLKLSWPNKMTLKQSVDWVREIYLPKLSSHVKFVKKGIEKYIGMADRLNQFTSLANKLEILTLNYKVRNTEVIS